MIWLNILERSSIFLSDFSCKRQLRMVCLTALQAWLLTAGEKLTKYFPQRFLDLLE